MWKTENAINTTSYLPLKHVKNNKKLTKQSFTTGKSITMGSTVSLIKNRSKKTFSISSSQLKTSMKFSIGFINKVGGSGTNDCIECECLQ